MEQVIQIFSNPQFGEIKQIDSTVKDTYYGFVYACEYGMTVKIGSTNQPYNRLMALIRQAESYGALKIGRFAITQMHTNYKANEKLLHNKFSVYRQEGTELFNIDFQKAVESMSTLNLLDETDAIEKRADGFLDGMKDFIGFNPQRQQPTPTDSIENGLVVISDVKGFIDKNSVVWLDAEDVAIGFGFTQVKNGTTYVKWDRVNLYLQEFGYSPRVGKGAFLPENMVYRLGFKANNQTAAKFQAILADEVLPSIRKTGGYIAATNDMTDEEIMAKALLVAQSTIERRDQRIKELETANKQQQARLEQASCQISEMSKDIDVMRPKAEYYDMLLNNKSTVLTTSIAQDYGMTAIAFNKVLSNLGIQRKVAGQWILYTQYIKKGYMQSKPITITRRSGMKEVKYNSEWTQSGRIFLYGILKKNGILPMIER